MASRYLLPSSLSCHAVLLRSIYRPYSEASISMREALRRANRTEQHQYQQQQRHQAQLAVMAAPFRKLLRGEEGQGERLAYGLYQSDLPADATNAALFKLLSLEYGSKPERTKHLVREAIKMFARGINDTGSPEVQAAIWSVRIHSLEEHVKHFRHDYKAERRIVEMKDQRRKLLKYLKRLSLERFFSCVDRLGLSHDIVESVTVAYPSFLYRQPKSTKT